MVVDENGSAPAPQVRLCYELQLGGIALSARLLARTRPDAPALGEPDCVALLPKLHALDLAIVREMRSGAFGMVGEANLARILPLLLQRDSRVGGERLQTIEQELRPHARFREGARATVELGLRDPSGAWVALSDGRLLAGNQAFFLRGAKIAPVASPAPWELSKWRQQPAVTLPAAITPGERDDLVKRLCKAGVPETDLAGLAVRRGPPDRFRAELRSIVGLDEPVAQLLLTAYYGAVQVAIEGTRPQSPYAGTEAGAAGLALIERELVAEEAARLALRQAGFRPEREQGGFLAHGDAAVRALDPRGSAFPAEWEIVRAGEQPAFRRDLRLDASVRWRDETGLLDLDLALQVDDDAQVALLLESRELIEWLHSGRRYAQLPDGSFVAPSRRFRQSLRLAEELGAQSGRATISPLCLGLLRRLGDNAAMQAADQATQSWLDEIMSMTGPQEVTPPASLAEILRDYQCRGLDWLAMLHRHRLTGILADDMGLGKTLQTLALLLLAREQEGPMPSLVIAPTSVVTVWRDEAARFVPEFRVALWHGPPAVRQAIRVSEWDLVVTSYGVLRRDAGLLAEQQFRYAIIDEAQSAKNAATQNARAIRQLKSQRRLALTGTPVENRPEELWAAFDFLAPGFLGTLRQFRKRYARPIAHGEEEPLLMLRARIGPLILRRLKAEVAKELPPKVESVIRCEMLPAQRALYEHIAGELRESVRRKVEKVGIEKAHLDILAALTRLRQICADPSLLPAPPGAKAPGSAKLELFGELMREALASERRVVVFSQFVQMQKRLIAVIESLGVKPLWLHGQTRHRDKVVDAFQTPSGPPVIVVSLKAGGTGLTLTRADTVMHYDPWWNPAVERQATDRTHRLGQIHQVNVYKLVCARSIEERVLAMAARKENLANELLGSEGGAGAKQISVDEVLALLS